MPIHEYKCTGCGDEIEVIQKISDEPLVECSKCKGKLVRLMSTNAFHLKGTGWYKTDYADKKADGKKDEGKKEDKKEVKKETTEKKKSVEKSTAKPEKSAA